MSRRTHYIAQVTFSKIEVESANESDDVDGAATNDRDVPEFDLESFLQLEGVDFDLATIFNNGSGDLELV